MRRGQEPVQGSTVTPTRILRTPNVAAFAAPGVSCSSSVRATGGPTGVAAGGPTGGASTTSAGGVAGSGGGTTSGKGITNRSQNAVVTGDVSVSETAWPADAQTILNAAGLESAYADLKTDF